jgi:hypothetical protein
MARELLWRSAAVLYCGTGTTTRWHGTVAPAPRPIPAPAPAGRQPREVFRGLDRGRHDHWLRAQPDLAVPTWLARSTCESNASLCTRPGLLVSCTRSGTAQSPASIPALSSACPEQMVRHRRQSCCRQSYCADRLGRIGLVMTIVRTHAREPDSDLAAPSAGWIFSLPARMFRRVSREAAPKNC